MPSADAVRIADRFAALHRRAQRVAFCEGLAGGLFVAAPVTFWGGVIPAGVACIASVVCGAAWMRWRTPGRGIIALRIEQLDPSARNVVVTAEELLRMHAPIPPHAVLEQIFASAGQRIDAISAARVVPATRAVTALGVALMMLVTSAVWRGSTGGAGLLLRGADAAVTVRVSPPKYLKRSDETVQNPTRLTVMRGSTLTVLVSAPGDSLELRTAAAVQVVRRGTSAAFTAQVVADSDGFLSYRTLGAAASEQSVHLIPVAVSIDSAPRVTIAAPGRDLLLPNGRQSIGLTIRATDDIALQALTLRYTRVSGSGERFTFTEGEVPLVLTRRNGREWEGRAQWDLTPLKLDAGDMVVYRALASDQRPGALPVESDALIAEVTSPGGVAAAGFALDPEQERYALSEQMVILKTERLLAAKSKMASDSFANAAAEIAVEQRRVRAEFVFMMGGEMEDAPQVDDASMTDLNEEAEAAGEDELAAGRMVNRGRVALLGAIRNMSRAAADLTAVDVASALTHEKTALKQLEVAFSHSRIILRALADHERLDLTRRLGGALSDAARSVHSVAAPSLPGDARAALALLRDVQRLSVQLPSSSTVLMELAERALRLGPSQPLLQRASQQWTAAATAIRSKQFAAGQQALDEGALAVQRLIREATATSGGGATSADAAIAGSVLDARVRVKPAGRP